MIEEPRKPVASNLAADIYCVNMGIKVHLYSGLKELTNGRDIIEVHGNTVGECLADLVRQFPKLKPELFDQDGKPSGRILVSINLKSAHPEEMDSPITARDELYLVRVIAGG